MRTTIDAGGRVVVPKNMRDWLGLVAGSEVEIELDGTGSGLRMAAVAATTPVTVAPDGLPVLNAGASTSDLTRHEQREVLEAVRDRRL